MPLISPTDGDAVQLGGLGVRFMAAGEGFALVEHPIAPRTLAAPMHVHEHEDEYSYVLEGRMGALLGEDVVYAEVGDLVFKPRNQWHTFWNAADEPCRVLEIIAPAGFENYFDEMVELLAQGPPDFQVIGKIAERYGLEVKPETIPELCERFGVTFGPPQ